MLFQIPDVLSVDELRQIHEELATAEFVDGKTTAGWYAKQVKNNQQLKRNVGQSLESIVKAALSRHPLFQVAVRPKQIHSLRFSRYGVGMSYGTHADNAMMGRYRADVSFTLFLSESTDYEGGELVIEGADDEQAYKLKAGSVIVYPSSTLHRVNEVTQGQRLVVVGWTHSLIRDPAQRELLFDIDTVRRSLFAQHGKTPEFDLLSKSVSNLLRRWAE
ncbi:Fe2+-dependent dioxygenase [Leptothoe spongobia]|uniref:Fe2+-dependent dioxygenase n=1 Tax=Leptothoe spongobia TAU-MAC 1115 TaxID=1967444 RepID=A0A947DDX2_9CYAN|nr:Fe2+-dependent dioxygenase [Leptothoe spongobia]MBT9314778.1 Fe2+-dependent dioxygenase [Leptothoe spongobia TAU-MAC 1115]